VRRPIVDVRIGVTYTAKEMDVELPDDTNREDLQASIAAALGDSDGVLWLVDRKGRHVGVPSSKVAYVEIGGPDEERKIGFGTT
jgi:hypothetical protein